MRLLVDEMPPQAITAQLRRRGHGVVGVTERSELRSLSDPDLFAGVPSPPRSCGSCCVVKGVDGRDRPKCLADALGASIAVG